MPFYDDLTEFIFVEQEPENADVIFIPGGPYGEIAVHAASLFHQGFSSVLIPSGKHSILDHAYREALSPKKYQGCIFETEADFFTEILTDLGVPKNAIFPEKEATFTYENAIYSRLLTDRLGISVKTALLSCQAYHARRALLYYQALFPEARILVSPTVTRGISRENWHQNPDSIDLVLGELERCGKQFHDILKQYPRLSLPFR